MKVKVRRLDKSVPLPFYGSVGAAGLDCSAREKIVIAPLSVGYVPLNVCLQPPKGHFVVLAARSSLHKRGLMLANGIGILDEDYSGNNDECKAILYNFSAAPVTVEKGDRIAQLIFRPYEKVEWEEVDDLGAANRGGFGTTGN